MDVTLPVIAGAISTIMFGLSTLPMLHKAFQTKDLGSYSLSNILLSNGETSFIPLTYSICHVVPSGCCTRST
jgi:uncharacterized protein with PQ loop repeat